MEDPSKLSDISLLRPAQYIDEGYAEIDNESTRSLDLGALDSLEIVCDWPDYEDDFEQSELMHSVFTTAFNGFLHLAPIDWSPQRMLDIGCGTGSWCIDMADSYPSAEVIGIERNPCQPIWVPPNLSFQIDDIEEEWSFTRPFDYIHVRNMRSSCDWPRLMQQCFENCIPGGWVEFQDIDPTYAAHKGSISKTNYVMQWLMHGHDINRSMSRIIQSDMTIANWMHEAGFIHVHVVKRALPILVSEDNLNLKQNDLCEGTQPDHSFSSINMNLASDAAGWSHGQVNALVDNGREGVTDSNQQTSIYLYTVYGLKP